MPTTLSQTLLSLFRPAPSTPKHPTNEPFFPYPPEKNPYQARHPWPPTFTSLSQKHQFRLERRYRRRAKLKYARPTWNKAVQLAQWGAILFVGVYGVFVLEIEDPKRGVDGAVEGTVRRRTIFDGFREKLGGDLGLGERGGVERAEEGDGG